MKSSLVTVQSPYVFEWTGVAPVYGQCPGMLEDGTITSLPQIRLDSPRQDILDYFNNSWALTEVLFSGLANEEAFYRRPYHQLRHPMIFYYGHPVALYINKLRVAGLIDRPLNAAFEALFEAGVDEMRWDDLHEGEQHIWPSVQAVRDYRKQAYTLIRTLIETHPFLEPNHLPITQHSPMWALVMGFEHERIHLETSSVLIRELPIDLVRKPDQWPAFDAHHNQSVCDNAMIAVAKTQIQLGKNDDFPTFGWDNEYGSERRSVRPFAASKQLISNGEFLDFVRAGGYTQEHYWSREGWQWRCFRNIKWPTFWVQDGPAGSHLYALRSIFEKIKMREDYPVCVNFHEAKAYCAWKSEQDGGTPYRLITEAEHHALRDHKDHPANHHLIRGGESAVTAFAANDKGFYDVFGNVWQWCEDHFHPLSGAKPHPYYDDFSTPCYDGQHQMILGGSFISTGDEASRFARFHFRPHFFQHAGFRIARSQDTNPASDAKILGNQSGAARYETQDMLNQYMLMHWGSDQDIWEHVPRSIHAYPDVVNLPVTCAELITRYATHHNRVLDLGCAVGRSTFEMARHFTEVIGIDYSREFIDKASALNTTGQCRYWRKDSGAQGTMLTATVDASIDRARIRFEQGDACALPLHLKGFDAVLMANVLCRLPDPVACLERMQGANGLVNAGGILVMTTPLSWLEAYTPTSRWLNGLEDVQQILTKFELIHQEELPFLIREHHRKFEFIITQASVWKRHS